MCMLRFFKCFPVSVRAPYMGKLARLGVRILAATVQVIKTASDSSIAKWSATGFCVPSPRKLPHKRISRVKVGVVR